MSEQDELVRYFIKETGKKFEKTEAMVGELRSEMVSQFGSMSDKITRLNNFKWKITGFALGVFFTAQVVSFLITKQLVREMFSNEGQKSSDTRKVLNQYSVKQRFLASKPKK